MLWVELGVPLALNDDAGEASVGLVLALPAVDHFILTSPITDCHDDAPRQAMLARTAVARADQCRQRTGQVGIGQNNQVVLGAAQSLHALAVRRGRPVN